MGLAPEENYQLLGLVILNDLDFSSQLLRKNKCNCRNQLKTIGKNYQKLRYLNLKRKFRGGYF